MKVATEHRERPADMITHVMATNTEIEMKMERRRPTENRKDWEKRWTEGETGTWRRDTGQEGMMSSEAEQTETTGGWKLGLA